MLGSKVLGLLAVAAGAVAQSNMSLCDKYTTALLKDNNGTNQATLLTLVVNTAVIGNYTQPNVGIAVPGILAAGKYNGTDVDLLGYFNGTMNSTNRGGMATMVNFLDGGGAVPLTMNMPAFANATSSNQYFLLNHLYELFGSLLGCTAAGFPAYEGSPSMYQVHKFMDLSAAEMGYFITQVGLSAASFGVSQADATAVGMALSSLFDAKCIAAAPLTPNSTADLQAICLGDGCPTGNSSACAAYTAAANQTTGAAGNSSSNSTSGSGSSGSGSGSSSAASIVSVQNVAALAAAAVGVAVFGSAF